MSENEVPPSVTFSDSSLPDEESTPLIEDGRDEPPKDKSSLVFAVFVLVGMTTLLPWNFFISLNNFWDYKFRDTNASEIAAQKNDSIPPTDLQIKFTSYLAVSSTVPNALFVIINALVGQRFSLMKRLSISLTLMIVSFTVITALAFADTDTWQKTFLGILLTLVVIVNINSAIFQGGSFGMAGKFPEKYMSAQMIGQAIGGVFPAIVDIVIVSLDVKEEDVGAICFLIASLTLALCLIALVWAIRTPFFQHYYSSSSNEDGGTENSTQSTTSTWAMAKLSWVYLASVLITFSTTLTLFPSVAVLVQSETYKSKSEWAEKYFTPVTVFLLFNSGDLMGRGLASWIKMPSSTVIGQCILLLSSLLRLLFIPLFLFCNIVTGRERTVLFHSDGDFIVIMALFSLSNGYIGNICMLHGPKLTTEKENQEAIALILIAGLVLGTGIGSFLSVPLVSSL